MERLTKRGIFGNAYFPKCFEEPCNGCGCQDDDCDMGEICEKLASYEDTGLTPDRIRQIDELYKEKCKELSEERKKHEWIPADQPPKPEEYVLLSFENFSVPMVGMYRDDGNGGAYCIGDDEESCISQYMLFVNAWMPLPEPYRHEGVKS